MLQTSPELLPQASDQVTPWIIDGRALVRVLRRRSFPVIFLYFTSREFKLIVVLKGDTGGFVLHACGVCVLASGGDPGGSTLCGGLEPSKLLWSNTSEKWLFITKVQPVSLIHWGLHIHRSKEKQCEYKMYSCVPFLKHSEINRPKRINVSLNNSNRMSHFYVQKLYNSKRINMPYRTPHALQCESGAEYSLQLQIFFVNSPSLYKYLKHSFVSLSTQGHVYISIPDMLCCCMMCPGAKFTGILSAL